MKENSIEGLSSSVKRTGMKAEGRGEDGRVG